ncbi:protein kinase superfamily protein [Actinidia rufa]|uniref:Protein kinase superfamily protein n=1 Tax=Actinidia rufa TaxID=165716 RepID=A0A7J0EE40_9ERIC|nr:protein kinase superfamily protein [Actinidia rufa]
MHSRIYRGVYKQRDEREFEGRKMKGSWTLIASVLAASTVALTSSSNRDLVFYPSYNEHVKKPVFCIITEYLAGSPLRKYLHQQEPYSLPLNIVLNLALDIAHGMQYLHSQGILQRDLKLDFTGILQNPSVAVQRDSQVLTAGWH